MASAANPPYGPFVMMLCPDVHDDAAVDRVWVLWVTLAQMHPPSLQPLATANRELLDTLNCIVLGMNSYNMHVPPGFPAIGDPFFGVTVGLYDDL